MGGLGTNPESELQNHVFIIKLSCFWVGSPGTDFLAVRAGSGPDSYIVYENYSFL